MPRLVAKQRLVWLLVGFFSDAITGLFCCLSVQLYTWSCLLPSCSKYLSFQLQISHVSHLDGCCLQISSSAVPLSFFQKLFVSGYRVRPDSVSSDVWLRPNWNLQWYHWSMMSGHVLCTFGSKAVLIFAPKLLLGNSFAARSCVGTFPWCKPTLALHHQLCLELDILHTSCDGLRPCNMFVYQLEASGLGLA